MNVRQQVFGSSLNVRKAVRNVLRTGQACGLAAMVCLPGSLASAQDGSRKTIEIFRGTSRSESSAMPAAPQVAPTPRIPGPAGGLTNPATREALAPLPRQAVELAAELAVQSTSTFERGLLPLEDYLEHLRFVTYVEQRAAQEQQQPQKAIAAAQQHVDRLAHAAVLLEEFRQPAAEGWLAESLLAQAATAEARANLAQLRGQKELASVATQRFQDLALQHLEAREFDTQVLGIGSLPTMAAAIELVARANGKTDASGVVQETRENILLTTERWHAAGAGIGRVDEVQQAQIAEAQSKGNWAIISRDMPQFAAAVAEAEQASRDLFDSRREFYEEGTASLADLTEALLVRNRIHQLAASRDGLLTPEMDAVWERDLSEVVALAGSIEDLRGRNTPDTQFVSLLNLVDQADHTRAPSTPVPATAPIPGSAPSTIPPPPRANAPIPAQAAPAPDSTPAPAPFPDP